MQERPEWRLRLRFGTSGSLEYQLPDISAHAFRSMVEIWLGRYLALSTQMTPSTLRIIHQTYNYIMLCHNTRRLAHMQTSF
jgi:hypothetical protein